MKKILIIAPHQDDELNIAGNICHQLRNSQLHILYITNGDYIPAQINKRYKEAENVAELIGAKDICYLGYGDNLVDRSLYHATNEEIIKSHAGFRETYGPIEVEEYHYKTFGKHALYTRENLCFDIKTYIGNLLPDIILCVDCDRHPDHRMTSLIFEEVIKELHIECNYNPIILKRFAYSGTWFGENDYFDNPNATETEIIDDYENHIHSTSVFPYLWQDRIQIKSDECLTNGIFRESVLYKGLLCYSSQYAIEHFPRIANADAVFWYRDINNLCLSAVSIFVSSGDGNTLNDFKLLDYKNILDRKSEYPDYSLCYWTPNEKDEHPYIEIRFDGEKIIKHIRIHQGICRNGFIRKIKLQSKSLQNKIIDLNETIINDIIFEIPKTDYIKLQILKADKEYCIREIEIFDHLSEFPWDNTPFIEYESSEGDGNVSALDRYRFRLTVLLRVSLPRMIRHYVNAIVRRVKK